MTMDERLFELYLSFEGPEAGPWNRSPKSLYLEYWTRSFISERVQIHDGIEVCNVGIGAGGWDNFLCDWLTGTGKLTSIDIDSDICELFEYRQKREEHPNPSTVVCADIMENPFPPASFDVVTVIGSTVTESGEYDRCLAACFSMVRPSGLMMYMDFDDTPSERFLQWIAMRGGEVVEYIEDETAEAYIYLVRRSEWRN